jgi:hypothetical protein
MIAAMRANFMRFCKFTFIQRIVALGTFYENAFGFDGALFVFFDVIDLRFVAAKP